MGDASVYSGNYGFVARSKAALMRLYAASRGWLLSSECSLGALLVEVLPFGGCDFSHGGFKVISFL
jgi:hypothetical protein